LPGWLNSLGLALLGRFQSTRDVQDISEAIQHQQRAVQLIPDGHANSTTFLLNLGAAFLQRFHLTGVHESLQSAVTNFRLSATSPSGSVSIRLAAARQWAQFSSPSEVLEAHSCIMQILPLISGFENTVQRRHETLVDISQLPLAASAVALSMDHPDIALEWLVEGRCIVWNQINQLRTPVDELRSRHPALAGRLSRLSRDLENAGLRTVSRSNYSELSMDAKISLEDEAGIHLKHAKDWEELLDTIRNIHQFKDFLRPRKCADIMGSLPEEGPVIIINIHPDRCDALALMAGADEPLHIRLPNFSYQEAERLAISLRGHLLSFGVRLGQPLEDDESSRPNIDVDFPAVLGVLWSHVVSPILEALSFQVGLPGFV
jgi:hypothetical protein